MYQVKLLLLDLTVIGDDRHALYVISNDRDDQSIVGDDRPLPEAPFLLSFHSEYPVAEAFLRLCRGERLRVQNPLICRYIKEEPSVIMTDRPMVLDYNRSILYIPE